MSSPFSPKPAKIEKNGNGFSAGAFVPVEKPFCFASSGVQGGGDLGIYAKYSAAREFTGVDQNQGQNQGANQGAEKSFSTAQKFDLVTERFALQSVVRRILPSSRTAKCCRTPVGQTVDVWHSHKHKSATFRHLSTCGSVWSCPVCAAKISERRRIEVLSAMNQHKAAGGGVLLLTLTNPHTNKDNLKVSLSKQALAMSHFNGQRMSKRLFADMSCVGTIRDWEITHGFANGWHPHFHILVFCDAYTSADLEAWRGRFYESWANACRLAKLPIPSESHGVRVDDGEGAAKYATKWGLENEVTKGHIKKAKQNKNSEKRRTPFDLLRSCLNDDDKQAGELFKEYALAFHGKRQLVWSKGLKDRFGINDKSDVEVADDVEETAFLLGSICLDDWRVILRNDRRFNARAQVLNIASGGDWAMVEAFIASLRVDSS